MGKEPCYCGAGTGQTSGQPQAIPDVRSARAAESARPRHGANDAGERGLRLYGKAPDLAAAEKRGPKTEEENGLMARCPWFVVRGSLWVGKRKRPSSRVLARLPSRLLLA